MNKGPPYEGPFVYQKYDDTFWILRYVHQGDARLSCSVEVEAWVRENIPETDFLFEFETQDMSPFESYTFLREVDAMMFKLRWYGK